MTAHVSAAARTSLRTVATTRSAAGSTRRSISPASMRKSGRTRRQHTWSVFCDSDDTHTASISYFAYARFELR